ncbi:MAG: GlsB/YeaQ/YmgE family stress response membrane protein [Anaerolineae bacterium]
MCNWISWLIVGAVAGWLASIVMKTNREQGLLMDIIVGVVGGFIGGYVLDFVGVSADVSGLNIASIFVAFVGAVIFLAALRMLRGDRRKR